MYYNSKKELKKRREKIMKSRKRGYGNLNLIGRTVEKLRKQRQIKQKDFIARLQVSGVDINPTSYSKLEGQIRMATDIELYFIAKILKVSISDLYPDDVEDVLEF